MRQPTPQEIEALRQRWREILKRAQEKGEPPTSADIQAANASNDPIVADLFAQTEKALEEYLDNRLSRLNTDPEDFRPAATNFSKLPVATIRIKQNSKAFR